MLFFSKLKSNIVILLVINNINIIVYSALLGVFSYHLTMLVRELDYKQGGDSIVLADIINEQLEQKRTNNIILHAKKIKELALFSSQSPPNNGSLALMEKNNYPTDDYSLYHSPLYDGEEKIVGLVTSSDPLKSISVIKINNKQDSYIIGDLINNDGVQIIKIFNDRVIVKKNTEYLAMILE